LLQHLAAGRYRLPFQSQALSPLFAYKHAGSTPSIRGGSAVSAHPLCVVVLHEGLVEYRWLP
jgi:hypothetical protein